MKIINKLIRLILILPIGILSGIIATFVLHLLLVNTLSHFVNPYPQLPERILTPFAFCMSFVFGGSIVSPFNKSKTAILLFAFQLALIQLFIFLIEYKINWFGKILEYKEGGLTTYLAIIGGYLGFYITSKQDVNINSNELKDDKKSEVSIHLIIALAFTLCIYNDYFRTIIFAILFLLMSLMLYFTFKDKLYTSTRMIILIIRDCIFLSLYLIGLIMKEKGLIISFFCLSLTIIGLFIIAFSKKEKTAIQTIESQ
jgi:hypothetical protein